MLQPFYRPWIGGLIMARLINPFYKNNMSPIIIAIIRRVYLDRPVVKIGGLNRARISPGVETGQPQANLTIGEN